MTKSGKIFSEIVKRNYLFRRIDVGGKQQVAGRDCGKLRFKAKNYRRIYRSGLHHPKCVDNLQIDFWWDFGLLETFFIGSEV